MKKIVYCLSLFMLVLAMTLLFGCAKTDGEQSVDEPSKTEATIAEISKYGHLILDIKGEVLFELGYEYGDVMTVTVDGKVLELPLCSGYNDVDNGVTLLRAESAEDAVMIAINMGDFATTSGIAKKVSTEENPGYRWDYLKETPVKIEISLKTKGAYRDQWLARQLSSSTERSDYPHLSDEAFANFRVIDTTGMGKNKIYRSSSPINPESGRNTYADKAARDAGIATIINLADASNTYEVSDDAYYLTCQVTYLNLGLEFLSDDATAAMARGMRFIINGEGPYLLHCSEGKDRAGFVSALLEFLMGATIDEVIEDYMETFYNYHGVERGTEKYDVILNINIINTLTTTFKVSDIYQADLAAEAEEYLMEDVGLSADEVAALKAKLGE